MDLEVTGHENESPSQHELGSRSGFDNNEDYWRSSKLSRTTELNKTLSFHQGIPLLRSTSFVSSDHPRRQEQMLSFSSSTSEKSDGFDFSKVSSFDYNNINKSSVSPYLQQISSSYCRNSGGYGGGGVMNTANMHGNLTGVKGPFSLSQWAELEQQALIYKYITANVPVPSTLLLSLKKSSFPYGSLPPNSFGWGSFHLGFPGGNMDPEPGRCRRTDGKKWRCSRDAVPDQKYCERHINRGRHRSRKPVEGQSGQNTLTTSAAAAAAVASSKVVTPVISTTVQSSDNGNHHLINPSSDSLANRVQNSGGPSTFPSATNFQQPKQTHPKQSNHNPFEFGLISSESLLNPSSKPYGSSSHSYLDFTNQTKHSSSWPEELKSDWTQLSMSTTTSSPSSPKLALSPLRLSREFDPAIHMGLGVNSEFLEPVKKVNNWIPISWGNSMGGPLGEVLKNATNSPKGVLQKSQAFGCLSNSSSGSSNVGSNNGENSKIGATLMNSSSGNGLNG